MDELDIDFESLFGIKFTPQNVPDKINNCTVLAVKKKTILVDELISKFKKTLAEVDDLKHERIYCLEELNKCRQELMSNLKNNETWEKKYNEIQPKLANLEQQLNFNETLLAARDSAIRQYTSLVKDKEAEISQLTDKNNSLKNIEIKLKSEEKWKEKYLKVLKSSKKLRNSFKKLQKCKDCRKLNDVDKMLQMFEEEENCAAESCISSGSEISSVDTGFEYPHNLPDYDSENDQSSLRRTSVEKNVSTPESVPDTSSYYHIASEQVAIKNSVEMDRNRSLDVLFTNHNTQIGSDILNSEPLMKSSVGKNLEQCSQCSARSKENFHKCVQTDANQTVGVIVSVNPEKLKENADKYVQTRKNPCDDVGVSVNNEELTNSVLRYVQTNKKQGIDVSVSVNYAEFKEIVHKCVQTDENQRGDSFPTVDCDKLSKSVQTDCVSSYLEGNRCVVPEKPYDFHELNESFVDRSGSNLLKIDNTCQTDTLAEDMSFDRNIEDVEAMSSIKDNTEITSTFSSSLEDSDLEVFKSTEECLNGNEFDEWDERVLSPFPQLLSPLPQSPRAASSGQSSNSSEQEHDSDITFIFDKCEDEEVSVSETLELVDAEVQTGFPFCSCQEQKRLSVDACTQASCDKDMMKNSDFTSRVPFNKYAGKHRGKNKKIQERMREVDSEMLKMIALEVLYNSNRSHNNFWPGGLQNENISFSDSRFSPFPFSPLKSLESCRTEFNYLPVDDYVSSESSNSLHVKPVTVLMNKMSSDAPCFDFRKKLESIRSNNGCENLRITERKGRAENKKNSVKFHVKKRKNVAKNRKQRTSKIKKVQSMINEQLSHSQSGTFVVSPIKMLVSSAIEKQHMEGTVQTKFNCSEKCCVRYKCSKKNSLFCNDTSMQNSTFGSNISSNSTSILNGHCENKFLKQNISSACSSFRCRCSKENINIANESSKQSVPVMKEKSVINASCKSRRKSECKSLKRKNEIEPRMSSMTVKKLRVGNDCEQPVQCSDDCISGNCNGKDASCVQVTSTKKTRQIHGIKLCSPSKASVVGNEENLVVCVNKSSKEIEKSSQKVNEIIVIEKKLNENNSSRSYIDSKFLQSKNVKHIKRSNCNPKLVKKTILQKFRDKCTKLRKHVLGLPEERILKNDVRELNSLELTSERDSSEEELNDLRKVLGQEQQGNLTEVPSTRCQTECKFLDLNERSVPNSFSGVAMNTSERLNEDLALSDSDSDETSNNVSENVMSGDGMAPMSFKRNSCKNNRNESEKLSSKNYMTSHLLTKGVAHPSHPYSSNVLVSVAVQNKHEVTQVMDNVNSVVRIQNSSASLGELSFQLSCEQNINYNCTNDENIDNSLPVGNVSEMEELDSPLSPAPKVSPLSSDEFCKTIPSSPVSVDKTQVVCSTNDENIDNSLPVGHVSEMEELDSPLSPDSKVSPLSSDEFCKTIPSSPVSVDKAQVVCSTNDENIDNSLPVGNVSEMEELDSPLSPVSKVSPLSSDEFCKTIPSSPVSVDKTQVVCSNVTPSKAIFEDEAFSMPSLSARPVISYDSDDGIMNRQSDSPTGTYLTRSKLRSMSGGIINSVKNKKFQHSLLNRYFTCYYPGKLKKPTVSSGALKLKENMEKKIQSVLDNFMNSDSTDSIFIDTLDICKKIPKDQVGILVKCIVRCVKHTAKGVYDYSNPNAAPLTAEQKSILALMVNLKEHHPTLVVDVLKRIHFIVCDFNHHHYESTLFGLARFFLAFCKLRNDKQLLQIFLYDSLYSLKLRGYGVLHAIITGFADVFPKVGGNGHDSLLMKTIVFIIYTYGKVSFVKTSQIRSFFSIHYGYKRDTLPTIEEFLKLFVTEIKKGTNHDVEQSVLLLSKFQSNWEWTFNKLIKGCLLPIVDSWKLRNASESAALMSLKLIGYLAHTPPYERDDVLTLLDMFENFISSSTCTSSIKIVCIKAVASLIYINECKVFDILKSCESDEHLENSEIVKETLNSVFQKRTNKWWKNYLKITNKQEQLPGKIQKSGKKK